SQNVETGVREERGELRQPAGEESCGQRASAARRGNPGGVSSRLRRPDAGGASRGYCASSTVRNGGCSDVPSVPATTS
ncbi:unnamed protein product, partial [Urochloa humidicola]